MGSKTATYEVTKTDKGLIKSWTKGVPVEDSARLQLSRIADMPFIYKHVAVMPDVHLGRGATIGSVIATKGAVIPAAVGVDLGCGMHAVRTTLRAEDLPDNLDALRSDIEAAVPHGRSDNGGKRDVGAWGNAPDTVADAWLGGGDASLSARFDRLCEKHPKLKQANHVAHLGTLGTGNHFIEVCLDKSDDVWLMLHSGSRGVGNRIGSYFIDRAKKIMEKRWISLPDKDLAYLVEGEDKDFSDYFEAVGWAQEFALRNREIMMSAVVQVVKKQRNLPAFSLTDLSVNCHHNYVQWEKHYGEHVLVTRKGAVSARLNQMGIIPGSMGARSFIVRGLGNRESFYSCSHGAGRKMSRTEAKNTFSVDEHRAATAGISCRKDVDVIDETPGAYKDIDAVMAAQADLVEPVYELRQVVCVKG